MELKKGMIINVQVYKHNGILDKQFNGVKMISANDKEWLCFMNKTKVVEQNGRKWRTQDPIFWLFTKDAFWNSNALIKKSGIFFYTNLASPPIFEDNTIKYIDYDLDIKSYPEKGIKIVDKKEYEINKKRFNYPKEIDNILNKTIKEVIEKIKKKKNFFNEKNILKYLKEINNLKN